MLCVVCVPQRRELGVTMNRRHTANHTAISSEMAHVASVVRAAWEKHGGGCSSTVHASPKWVFSPVSVGQNGFSPVPNDVFVPVRVSERLHAGGFTPGEVRAAADIQRLPPPLPVVDEEAKAALVDEAFANPMAVDAPPPGFVCRCEASIHVLPGGLTKLLLSSKVIRRVRDKLVQARLIRISSALASITDVSCPLPCACWIMGGNRAGTPFAAWASHALLAQDWALVRMSAVDAARLVKQWEHQFVKRWLSSVVLEAERAIAAERMPAALAAAQGASLVPSALTIPGPASEVEELVRRGVLDPATASHISSSSTRTIDVLPAATDRFHTPESADAVFKATGVPVAPRHLASAKPSYLDALWAPLPPS